jgi:hypothetical protein
MKKIIVMILIMIFTLIGCGTHTGESGTDKKKTQKQEQAFKDMYNKIGGDPNITKWTEAKQLKKIYELRDDAKLICYLYTKSEVTGKYVYEGRCQGFGIPYSTQYSNPEKPINYERELDEELYDGEPVGNLPQPEPNGLFMPTSSSATWVMMIDSNGDTEVQYYESLITVTQSKKPAKVCEKWSLPEDY